MKKTEEMLHYLTADGQEIHIPVVTLEGDEPGLHAVFTAGVHGCEYPPILAATEFCRTTDLKDIRGKVTFVTICTLPSFQTRTPFVNPVDGKNPNRFFPGDVNGSHTECINAHIYNEIISKADYHIDLHCGDMTEILAPFCEYGISYGEKTDRMNREIGLYCGVKNLIEDDIAVEEQPKGLNYLNSTENGIASAIFELGQMGRTDREYVEGQLFCIRNILRHFGNLAGEAVPTTDATILTTYGNVYAPETGIFVRCVEAGDDLAEGQKVGEMFDYFGNFLCDVTTPVPGRVMVMTSSPAVTKGMSLGDIVR